MTARPLRVVRIITRLNIGGPSVHATLLSTQLDPARFSTCLVVGVSEQDEGDVTAWVQGSQARVVRLRTLCRSIHPWADVVTLGAILRVLWQERPQIIHTHMAKAGALGRLAACVYNGIGPGRAPAARASVLHTFHGHVLEGYFSPRLSRLFVNIERWLAQRTDCLIAVSRTVQQELLEKGIGRPAQWRVIPLGLDLACLAQLPMPNGATPVRCGMVGRLVPIKNPSLFLEALQHVVHQGCPVLGVMVGDGPLRRALEFEAQRRRLQGIVGFAGWQHDVAAVYGGLDIACLTSWNEGTPVALIEAMAAGRPVIATNVGGVGDLLDDQPDASRPPIEAGGFRVAARGILVQPGDVGGFAAGLQVLVGDVALRQRLGAAGRSYALDRFHSQRLMRDISQLYDALHERRG